MNLEALKNKKILILGFAREGIDTFKFLRKLFPKKVLGVGDRSEISNFKFQISNLLKKDKKVKLHLGEDYLKHIKNYDVIIKTPGIPPKVIAPFITKHQRVTSQTEIFFENCKGLIVGITGTKGKSTTAALIYQILKQGLKVHPVKFASQTFNRVNLVGNIGKPVLSLLFSATPKDVYIHELSSHQLFGLKKSPQIAVFLNIYSEHLDYYKNFNEYLKAKQNICRYQKVGDYFIYNSEDKNVRETAKKTRARKIPIDKRSIKKNIDIKDIPLKGEFNLLNVAAAIEVGKIFKIPLKKIKTAIKKFKPLPHRLEFIGTHKGIKFYNDSLSTIPETTIGALDALGKDVKTIMLGGFERNLDFTKLAKKLLANRIKNVILFPTTGERIWQKISHLAKSQNILPKHFFVNNMRDAVRLAYQHTKKGEICLLSCASPSFSVFRDYKEKGNLFKKYVKKYGKKS